MEIAAVVAATALAFIALFQVALAAGAPWGSAAWGGQHPGILPAPFRIASAVAGVAVYPLLMAVVLVAGGVLAGGWLPGTGRVLMWCLTGFFALGVLANGASRSRAERIWAPVSLVVAVCCAVIALG